MGPANKVPIFLTLLLVVAPINVMAGEDVHF